MVLLSSNSPLHQASTTETRTNNSPQILVGARAYPGETVLKPLGVVVLPHANVLIHLIYCNILELDCGGEL